MIFRFVDIGGIDYLHSFRFLIITFHQLLSFFSSSLVVFRWFWNILILQRFVGTCGHGPTMAIKRRWEISPEIYSPCPDNWLKGEISVGRFRLDLSGGLAWFYKS